MDTFKMGSLRILGAYLCSLQPAVWAAPPDNTAFEYQGHVTHNDLPVWDTCDFRISLWAAENGGSPFDELVVQDVDVIGGLFTLDVDFGSDAFNGAERWLLLETKCSDDSTYQALGPRQLIGVVPYAIHTRGINVDEAGNVGIGTTSPQYKLDVSSSSAVRFNFGTNGGGQLYIDNVFPENDSIYLVAGDRNYNASANALHIVGQGTGPLPLLRLHANATYATGRIGIGTSDPRATLHLHGGPADATLLIESTDSTARDQHIHFKDPASDWYVGNRWDLSNRDAFGIGRTSQKNDLVMDSNGNVGIGTTSPDLKLEIAGDFGRNDGSVGLRLWGSEIADRGDEILHIRSGGGTVSFDGSDNVGIGTATPSAKLDVVGNIVASGEIRSTTGGIRFPDGTLQTTAASGSGGQPFAICNQTFLQSCGNFATPPTPQQAYSYCDSVCSGPVLAATTGFSCSAALGPDIVCGGTVQNGSNPACPGGSEPRWPVCCVCKP